LPLTFSAWLISLSVNAADAVIDSTK
jgi:hypothetical protein